MSCTASSIHTHYGPDPTNHPDQKEVTAILENLHKDIIGYISLGTDGVLRSLNIENEVIDAIGLPPRLLKAFLDRTPYEEEVEVRFKNADGTLIPREKWLEADASQLRAPLTAEKNDELRREYEENKEIIEENLRRRKNGETLGCGVRILSNYNI